MGRSALAVMMLMAMSIGPGLASECEPSHDPAPDTNAYGPIDFFNDTPYAFRVLWIDFDGLTQDYGLLQPGESVAVDSYLGHRWLIEAYTPDDTVCVGPIELLDQEGCSLHILEQDGYFGFDGNAACGF